MPVEWIQSAGDRMAVNMPIQGSAQDILKQAMVAMNRALHEDVKWLLQVHDELIWEMPERLVPWFIPSAKSVMENITRLSVPLEVEAKVGLNWGQMEKR